MTTRTTHKHHFEEYTPTANGTDDGNAPGWNPDPTFNGPATQPQEGRRAVRVRGLAKVCIPDPSNPGARIVGFRIREGDEAWGEFGLSEPLFWLDHILAALEPDSKRVSEALRHLLEKIAAGDYRTQHPAVAWAKEALALLAAMEAGK